MTQPNFECYYFIKGPSKNDPTNGHPFACVCLQGNKKDSGKWSFNRGVSICSSKDSFKRKVGRTKAKAVLANGQPKTAVIRNQTLQKQIVQIYWVASRLDLKLPNMNPKYGKNHFVLNNEYKKAEFGISYENLTTKEKEIVSGFVEEG